MPADKFAQFYQKLNPAQQEAVDSIEGPVMVVAGPGTGKTQVLTLRIANILRETDTPPDGILALTFTNSSATAMRERLVELIGSAGYRVNINTFHGFGNEIIRAYPEEFPRIIGSRHASRVEQIKILEQVIEQAPLKILRPYGAPFYYLPAALAEIERLKKDNQTTASNKELNIIYRGYERELRRRRLYDFADMIMEVLAVLKKKKNFLRRLQEEFLYLLADEHQDANQSQNELLALLANFHPNPNLFIVGDEKQAIFQFQGASLENFNYFKKLYPSAKLIYLTHSYRSTQNILDAAHSLIDSGRLLAANNLPAEKVKVISAADPTAEVRWIAADIKTQIAAGTAPDEVAIIYRDNADAEPIREALERAGVPLVIHSQSDLLTDLTISKVILILETIHHFGDDSWLPRFLHLDFLAIDPLAAYQIRTYRDLPKEVYQKLAKWQRLAHNANLLELFGAVLEDSGLLDYLLQQPAAEDQLARLQLLHEEIRELASNQPNYRLTDFILHLATLRRHELGLYQTIPSAKSGVRLLTAHKSKGLEFDQVYIIGATNGHFGQRRKKSSFRDEIDDGAERRLFYVALTRARRGVTITYAKATRDGRPQLPSQFIEEIDKKLINFVMPADARPEPSATLRPRPISKSALTEKAYLNKLFLERGLSVTDLNNYLACPRQYFYNNLLRLTQVRDRHLLYGTAVHQTLKEFFDQYREGKKWLKSKLLARLRYHFEQQPFSSVDLKETLAKGKKALTGYLAQYKYRWPNRIINELNIRGVELTPRLRSGQVKLNGKIDKLEISENGETRVVDYKTGKPKTRNHILGLTKSAGSGDYFRQLVFYKLLLDNYDRGKYRVTSGLIDFIEPDEKGRYKQEEFALSPSDVTGLTQQVHEVSKKILDLDFFTSGCGRKDCEWCRLWSVTH